MRLEASRQSGACPVHPWHWYPSQSQDHTTWREFQRPIGGLGGCVPVTAKCSVSDSILFKSALFP